jgi:hypothetical protein
MSTILIYNKKVHVPLKHHESKLENADRAPCIITSVLHEGERAPSSPASSFHLCDKSRQYPLNRTRGEALSRLDASEYKQMPFRLCRPGHGQVTRLKLSPRQRHEILFKKNVYTHWRALHTLSCDKILWTYKEYYKTLFNKFFVRSAHNECIISRRYVRSSVT